MGPKSWVELTPSRPGSWGRLNSSQLFRFLTRHILLSIKKENFDLRICWCIFFKYRYTDPIFIFTRRIRNPIQNRIASAASGKKMNYIKFPLILYTHVLGFNGFLFLMANQVAEKNVILVFMALTMNLFIMVYCILHGL